MWVVDGDLVVKVKEGKDPKKGRGQRKRRWDWSLEFGVLGMGMGLWRLVAE